MRNKLTVADIVLIAFLSLGSLAWLGFEFYDREQGGAVEVYNQEGLYRRLDLDSDARLSVPGPLGKTMVIVHAGQVHISDSPCPDKVCIEMGAIAKTGETLLCAPNHVSVRVVGQEGAPDAVSY